MSARFSRFACGCVAAFALAMAQDGEAPPAIAQGGITNWASHMPSQLASGAIAPGSLIRIRGWRLGPAPLSQVEIRIRRGQTVVNDVALDVSENEIEARVPSDAPLGDAMLQVVKNGQASLEWPVTIAPSSFGAFSRNGLGWGPAALVDHPTRPGDPVILGGTGLGPAPYHRIPQVLVGGLPAGHVQIMPADPEHPGVDRISFKIPSDAPLGCHVPVVVSSAPGIYSNTVSIAISRSGVCSDETDWTPGEGRAALRLGAVALLQADLEINISPSQTQRYPVDAGFASFVEVQPQTTENPLFEFPPLGTCSTYNGTAGLHSITSPLSLLQSMPGDVIDAGDTIEVSSAQSKQTMPASGSTHKSYGAVLGGHAPIPGAHEKPLFLAPGNYLVRTPGGAIGAFETALRVRQPMIWTNREQITAIASTHGTTVTWQPSKEDGTVELIAAMNVDSRTGAMGVSACLAPAASGRFEIPAYALANIPKSPDRPRGFPLNLMLLAELPARPVMRAPVNGLDRVLAFTASIAGRTVIYK